MMVWGKRAEGGGGGRGKSVGAMGWEPVPREWEDHMGADGRREEGLACQKGRSHEGHGVEAEYGQRRVWPRWPQPAYQAWRYITTRGQEDAGWTGDSSTREVAGARDEVGCRKGDEARAWEQKGWGEAHGQGRTVRRGKFHTERHEPEYEPWEGCNTQPGRERNRQPAQDERERCQWTRWKD